MLEGRQTAEKVEVAKEDGGRKLPVHNVVSKKETGPSKEQQGGEGEKNHKKGGLNCVFGNFFFYVLDNCPQVQSLK